VSGEKKENLNEHRISDISILMGLFVCAFGILWLTAGSIGLTRDDSRYMSYGVVFFDWYQKLWELLKSGNFLNGFEPSVIDSYWKRYTHHPVLTMTLMGASQAFFKEGLNLPITHVTAFRMVAWFFSALSVAGVYVLSRLVLNRRFALLACLLWFSMPRVFWQMHVGCFDIPVTAMQILCVYLYLKYRGRNRVILIGGLALGLAMATKHNAFFVPVCFFVIEIYDFIFCSDNKSFGEFTKALMRIALIGVIACVVFFSHWPYLWTDLLGRFAKYIQFQLDQPHYPIMFFGELLTQPPFPWFFPFVMSAITVPLPTLVLFVLGASFALFLIVRSMHVNDSRGVVALMLLLCALIPFLLIAWPQAPVYGGTKHWMNGLPYLCILGAWFFQSAAKSLPKAVIPVLFLIVLMPAVLMNIRVHPYGLAQYNSVVGFTRGAANRGFQRTFWGHEVRMMLDKINEKTPPKARIYMADTNPKSWEWYQRDGLLRDDIGKTYRISKAAVLAAQPQGEFKEKIIHAWNSWGRKSEQVVHLEGVPLAVLHFKDDE